MNVPRSVNSEHSQKPGPIPALGNAWGIREKCICIVAGGFWLVKRYFMYYDMAAVLVLNEKYAGMVKRLIERAKGKIDICQFKIDSAGVAGNGVINQILVTLVKKAEEGVQVRCLLDCILPLRGRSANNTFVALWLKKRGVKVRYLPMNRCQHAKAVVVDGAHALVGSHNWTVNSLMRNEEWSIYFTDCGMIGEIEGEFERVFGAAFEYGANQVGRRGVV